MSKRTWGIFLIPRDKAPDEGWLLTHTDPRRQGPNRKPRWRAWWLPLGGLSEITGEENVVPAGPHYRANRDLLALVNELVDDHIAASSAEGSS